MMMDRNLHARISGKIDGTGKAIPVYLPVDRGGRVRTLIPCADVHLYSFSDPGTRWDPERSRPPTLHNGQGDR